MFRAVECRSESAGADASIGIHSFMSSSLGPTAFVIFAVLSVVTLKELNVQVTEPYMVRSPFAPVPAWSQCASGRALSRPTSPGILQRRLVLLGSENHDTSRAVRLSVLIAWPR